VNLPSFFFERFSIPDISFLSAVDFGFPKLFSGIRQTSFFTIMPMPETTMYENNSFIFGKNNIWFSGITFVIFEIAKAFGEEEFAHDDFRFGFLAENVGLDL
jgi:hypothetical protein